MRRILSFFIAVFMAATLGTFAYAADDPQMTMENNMITVENAPQNSTLITAFYKNNALSDVKLYQGSGTITADISQQMEEADLM